MGLDMYLFTTERTDLDNQKLKTLFFNDDTPSLNESEVAYFRKVNAIHQWFVKNVQDGIDECDPHIVSKEKLQEIRDVCLKILKAASISPNSSGIDENFEIPEQAKELADKLLPTQGGFFFGSTKYDTWYFNDLLSAVEQFNDVLEDTDFENETLFYWSSW